MSCNHLREKDGCAFAVLLGIDASVYGAVSPFHVTVSGAAAKFALQA